MVVTDELCPEQKFLQCEIEKHLTIHSDIAWRAMMYTCDRNSTWDVHLNMYHTDSDTEHFSGTDKAYTELGVSKGSDEFGEFTKDVNNNNNNNNNNNKGNMLSRMDSNLSADYSFANSSCGLEASFDEATGETRVKIGAHEYPIDRSSFLTDLDACPQSAHVYTSTNRVTYPDVTSNEAFELAKNTSPVTIPLAKDGTKVQIQKDCQADFKHTHDYWSTPEPVLQRTDVLHPLSSTDCRCMATVPSTQRPDHSASTVTRRHRTMSDQAMHNVNESVIGGNSSPIHRHQVLYSTQSVDESVIGGNSSPMRRHQVPYSTQSVDESVIGGNSSPMRRHQVPDSVQSLGESFTRDTSSPIHRQLEGYTIDIQTRDMRWTQSEYPDTYRYENHHERPVDITDVSQPNSSEQWTSSLSNSSISTEDYPPSCSPRRESQIVQYDTQSHEQMQFGTPNCAISTTWSESTVDKPEATGVSSFSTSRYCPDLPQPESLLKSSQRFTKKKTWKRGCRLWEYIRNLLLDPNTNPSLIRWENHSEGTFKLVQNKAIAHIWGMKKGNEDMSYDKLSRAMRYYYKKQIFQPVIGKRLVYRFGPRATGWKGHTLEIGTSSSP